MKVALLVGIDHYPTAPLAGCVNDALRMRTLLKTHANGDPNFECKAITSVPGQAAITRASLKQAATLLFSREADIALFFFAGHGTVNNLGGYLVTQDATRYDEGLAMTDLLKLANDSPARERIVILDCCHSGAMGQLPAIDNDAAMLKEGVSILSAAREKEPAMEARGGGIFTSLICAALEGGAADVLGKVTVASAYAYADEALGGFEQRPLVKTHVSNLVPLRKCAPVVSLEILRKLPEYFGRPGDEFQLDPSYEPTAEPHHAEHERIFGHLQQFRAARLLVPVGEEHMYYAAINRKSCRLTALGMHYWTLAKSERI